MADGRMAIGSRNILSSEGIPSKKEKKKRANNGVKILL